MFYTLDRIEDNNIAVLCDDDGRIHNVNANILQKNISVGDVFTYENGKYIPAPDETALRKARISEKKNAFFNRIKNRN